ncbi:MAG: glycosyltransferase family 2 protein [Mycobacteriaceae bacterium]
MTDLPELDVVVLAWGDEPYLLECVQAVLDSDGVRVHVVLVDNGADPAAVAAAADLDGVTLLVPGRNTGFAGGCNLGVAASAAPLLGLVNSDCLVAPDTLAALVTEARRPGTGPVMASVRMAEEPAVINSAGNPVHVLGVSWAGRLGETEERTEPYDVTAASGACLVLARELWNRLGGFDEEYFAYVEDTELSLRARRTGRQPRCVPTAVARHHYEFSRNSMKMYLLERNRLMLLATVWSGRALVLLAPLLLVLELGVLAQALAQGWAGGKVRGWWWLLRHWRHVRARRTLLQAEAVVTDAEWMQALTATLDPQVIGSATATRAVNVALGAWWRLVRPLL